MRLIKSIFNLLKFNKRNWKAMVLCLVAATVFWFLNALNENYTTNIRFPLEFAYDQVYYTPVKPLPEDISINVTGNGWDLFRRSVGLNIPPLLIPLERPSEVKKIVGSTLPALFSNQLQTLEINFVVVDTVYIDIHPKGKRWITLTIDSIQQYVRDGYGITGKVSIDPDSIFIEGPVDMISGLTEPYDITLNDSEIDENFSDDIEVKFVTNLIKRNPPTVKVSFNVERFIDVGDSVKLIVANIPLNANPKIQTRKIFVSITIPASKQSEINFSTMQAVLDLRNLSRGSRRIAPRLEGRPSYAKIARIDSVNVFY